MTFKRLPIIRHLRYYWHRYWFYRWFTSQPFGIVPNPSDLAFLDRIWEGTDPVTWWPKP